MKTVEMKITDYLISEMEIERKKTVVLIDESIRLINESNIIISQERWDYIGREWNKEVQEFELNHSINKDLDPCKIHEVQSTNGLQSGYADDNQFIYDGNVFERGHFREIWNGEEVNERDLKQILDKRPTASTEMQDDTINLSIDWYDIQKIYEGLWSLKGTAIRGDNILRWLRNVKTSDAKRVMTEHNILIMSNKNGIHVCSAKKPITNENLNNNLKHLRDHITLKQGYLENSHHESLASYIGWLRRSGAKKAILWDEDEHMNRHDDNYDDNNYVDLVLQLRKRCDTNKLILDRLGWHIAAELFGIADENEEICDAQINELMYSNHEDLE